MASLKSFAEKNLFYACHLLQIDLKPNFNQFVSQVADLNLNI